MKRLSAILILLAACGGKDDPIAHVSKPQRAGLAVDIPVPDFTFLESRDRTLSKKDLLQKVWICSFIFTHCPTHCVEMSREMKQLQSEFEDAPDFRIVAVTVDPARDTTKRLRWFAKNWEAEPDRWYFLTGNRKDIVKFCLEGMKNSIDEQDPLFHSLKFTLVDRKGHIRGYYDLKRKDEIRQMRSDIKTLLAQP